MAQTIFIAMKSSFFRKKKLHQPTDGTQWLNPMVELAHTHTHTNKIRLWVFNKKISSRDSLFCSYKKVIWVFGLISWGCKNKTIGHFWSPFTLWNNHLTDKSEVTIAHFCNHVKSVKATFWFIKSGDKGECWQFFIIGRSANIITSNCFSVVVRILDIVNRSREKWN